MLLLSVDSSMKLVEVLSRCVVTVIVLLRLCFRERKRERERERETEREIKYQDYYPLDNMPNPLLLASQ